MSSCRATNANLARIGRKLAGTVVRAELRLAPCGALLAAAKYNDEEAQIRAAMRWRIGLRAPKGWRRPRRRS